MKFTDILRPMGRGNKNEGKEDQWKDQIQTLPIELIEANPYQPRIEFESEGLEELAESISVHGILHPLVVRKTEQGYQLVAGERRLRACKKLGWTTVPAIVRKLDDRLIAEMALIENLQRRDLHFFEEAEGYSRLLQEFQLTQEELANRLGKSQSSIANRLRLLKLEQSVRDIISREMLTERHARALLKLKSTAEQLEIVETVAKDSLNVRQTEELINAFLNKSEEPKPGRVRKLIFKDIRLFTNSVKELTNSLQASGLTVDYNEEEEDDHYKVTVLIKKPERREQ